MTWPQRKKNSSWLNGKNTRFCSAARIRTAQRISAGRGYRVMWREARLAFSDAVAAAACSVVPAHPWIYGLGQQTENGTYLSPVNAVQWLAGKLAGRTGHTEVVVFMVTGQTYDSFIPALN